MHQSVFLCLFISKHHTQLAKKYFHVSLTRQYPYSLISMHIFDTFGLVLSHKTTKLEEDRLDF